jgi:hypothetical protein
MKTYNQLRQKDIVIRTVTLIVSYVTGLNLPWYWLIMVQGVQNVAVFMTRRWTAYRARHQQYYPSHSQNAVKIRTHSLGSRKQRDLISS